MDVDTQFSARTTDADATGTDKIGTYGKKTTGFPDGQLHWMDENSDAHPVADEDYVDAAASDAVTTHEAAFDHSLLPTADQKAAMDAANSPTAGNAFATIADVGGGGGSGDVVGPASAVDGNVVLFDTTTGKLIKDAGVTISGTNTGDMTDNEVRDAVEAATDSNTFTDGDHTNLNNQSGTNTGDEPDATTSAKGIVELATDGESAANVVVQGNDARLSDARAPTNHASTHTDGTDDIQDATAAQKGLATATQITKLDGIATGATVGDADAIHDNVAGEILAITEKLSPVGADVLLIEDSAAGNAKKRVAISSLPGGGGGDMLVATYDPTAVAGDAFDADNHVYNNSTSGLTATDVQAAIDEIDGDVDTLQTDSHTHANKAQLDLVTDGDHDVRTDNPHGVTAVQAGAAPTAHTHTHASTTGQGANDHHAEDHKDRHKSGGADAFTSADLIDAVVRRLRETSGPTDMLIGAVADGEFLKRSGTSIVGDTPAGGGGSITTTNINWVDKAGNDGTAIVDRMDLPWLTIGAALTASASGDVVIVRPGTYAESGLTVPGGVALISQGGFLVTIVGDAAAVAHIITLSAGSLLQGFRVICPTTASLAGVSHSSGTATVYNLDLRGDGGTGSGDGIYKTGTGKIVGGNIRCEGGGLENLLRVDAAVLALDDIHVPQSTGTIGNVVLTEGTGRFQGQGVNVGNTNVDDCIHVAGTSTCIIYSPNWFNVPIGGHLAADGVTVTIIGGRIDTTVASLLIDPALAGTGTKLTVSGTAVQPLFSFPSAAITTMELSAHFHQEATETRNAEVRSVGADLTTGFPELGAGLSIGEGSPFSDGQVVFTSDSTASPSSDGSTLTDISEEAKSKTNSTFTFQGTGAGNSILWCTDRTDGPGVALKHWGIELGQAAAAVLGGGSFIFEIQTAASTWVEIEVMAVSKLDQFRYANNVFLRANGDETIRAGIDTTTSWAETTISGTTGYWMRVRIASTVSTAPVFERMRLIPSHLAMNARGQIAAKGLAHWRSTLFGAGNMWGEGGGAADYTVTVGSGSSSAGETWSNKNKKGRINNSNDFVNFNFIIPGGICTAFPLKFRLLMSSVGAGNVDMRMSVLPHQVLNNLIADSAGGLTPIARTSADQYDANAAQVVDLPTFSTVADTIQAVEFEGFDISDFYSDDMLSIRVGFDPGGSSRDVDIWALSIEGVRFTDGKNL